MAKIGLVLSGGGARGAYQAGVIKALTELSLEVGNKNPFPVVTGVSAGAVNAYFWSAHADDIEVASKRLVGLWENLSSDRIFRTDLFSILWMGSQILLELAFGAIFSPDRRRSLLDTSPLGELLRTHARAEEIQRNIDLGYLDGLGITAVDYHSSTSVTFVHGHEHISMWERARRTSQRAKIGPEHVLASAAIPVFFPSTLVGDRYFGDGGLRNTAPLSPAIHMGAEKLVVVGVRKQKLHVPPVPLVPRQPTFGKIIGNLINSVLMDAIDADVERLTRVNRTLSLIPESKRQELALKPIDCLWLTPSVDLGQLAGQESSKHPWVIRYLLAGLGGARDSREITSYLLFEADYTRRLIDLGYKDTIARREEVSAFLKPSTHQSS